jgi:hypothetical protein
LTVGINALSFGIVVTYRLDELKSELLR